MLCPASLSRARRCLVFSASTPVRLPHLHPSPIIISFLLKPRFFTFFLFQSQWIINPVTVCLPPSISSTCLPASMRCLPFIHPCQSTSCLFHTALILNPGLGSFHQALYNQGPQVERHEVRNHFGSDIPDWISAAISLIPTCPGCSRSST